MRRFARELALQVLFQTEFSPQTPLVQSLDLIRAFLDSEKQGQGHPFNSKSNSKSNSISDSMTDPTADSIKDNTTADPLADEPAIQYASALIDGVHQFKIEIDRLIQAVSQHWKLDRMATVDRNILRIAIYEMVFMSSPLTPNIAINEAVEIAKRFSTIESASFINGILDQARTHTP